MSETVREIPVAEIDASPHQPRRRFAGPELEELARSIAEHGVLQPLLVRRLGERYELIAGERRLRAARRAGLESVPALVRRFSDEEALEAALIENLQREDITVVEEALSYERLTREFGYTQAEIARRIGRSRAAVANTLRLLQLPEAVLARLDEGELSEGHARALLALPYPSQQAEVAEWILRNAVTVREAERRIRALAAGTDGPRRESAAGGTRDPNVAALEERLRRRFGTRAILAYRHGRGHVTLEFYNDEDLERILELLGLPEGE